jgi:hypothetical protein
MKIIKVITLCLLSLTSLNLFCAENSFFKLSCPDGTYFKIEKKDTLAGSHRTSLAVFLSKLKETETIKTLHIFFDLRSKKCVFTEQQQEISRRENHCYLGNFKLQYDSKKNNFLTLETTVTSNPLQSPNRHQQAMPNPHPIRHQQAMPNPHPIHHQSTMAYPYYATPQNAFPPVSFMTYPYCEMPFPPVPCMPSPYCVPMPAHAFPHVPLMPYPPMTFMPMPAPDYVEETWYPRTEESEELLLLQKRLQALEALFDKAGTEHKQKTLSTEANEGIEKKEILALTERLQALEALLMTHALEKKQENETVMVPTLQSATDVSAPNVANVHPILQQLIQPIKSDSSFSEVAQQANSFEDTKPDLSLPSEEKIANTLEDSSHKDASVAQEIVSETHEDHFLEEQRIAAALQEERALKEKKEAELQESAAQEDARKQQEKDALEALQKIQEAEKVKKFQAIAHAQALKKAKEDIQKQLDEKRKHERAEQAKKDKEAAALKKKELEEEKKRAQQAGKKTIKTPSSNEQTPKPAKKKGAKASAKDDDDALLEKAIAQANAEKSLLVTEPSKPSKRSKRSQGKASSQPGPAVENFNIENIDGDDQIYHLYEEKSGSLFTLDSQLVDKRLKELAMIEKIQTSIEFKQYAFAKQLLTSKGMKHDSLEYFLFLKDIYLNARHLLNLSEIENLMANALRFANDKETLPQYRSKLYFLLAVHAQNPTEKEKLLNQSIELDEYHDNHQGLALKDKLVLAEYDSTNPVCKMGKEECLHTKTFLSIKEFIEEEDDEERDSSFTKNIFIEIVYLKIQLLVKAISAPGSCRHLDHLISSLRIDPRRTLIDFYNSSIRETPRNADDIREINSFIPPDIIPADQLHQPA